MNDMQACDLSFNEAGLLGELLEVPGVIGSWLVGTDGALLTHRLPRELEATAKGAAPRLAVLLDALSGGRAVRDYCLRFAQHRLHVLTLEERYLCVLTDLWTPSPVLKMALNVTGRRLS
jgi:hypothetical protein